MMQRPSAWRLTIAAGALILLLAMLALFVYAADALLDVWGRLHSISPSLAAVYGLVLLGFAAAAVAIAIWLLREPRQVGRARAATPPNEDALRADIEHHALAGVDTDPAEAELRELTRRRCAGSVFVAVYGEVSSGKSSLIRALIPGARVRTDVRGGTTREISEYDWRAPSGDRIRIADVPGFNDAAQEVTEQRLGEAVRAHLVVYVCEADLTRSQWRELETLLTFDKPLIVALNKADRYTATDLESIRTRLLERLPELDARRIVTVQAGGEEEIVRRAADGTERMERRPRAPRVDALAKALQAALDRDGDTLSRLRDDAVFLLAARKLDHAVDAHRQHQAKVIADKYTRYAVVGALAALSPGSDIIIQGALATRFVRELCALFEVPARAIDVEATLHAANARAHKSIGLVLAVAGNAFKAFPGIGTVTGGLMHAVAYGLLFDTLGRALTDTLATRGELRPQPAARRFEEMLGEDLGSRAKRLARLALEHKPARHEG